MSLSGCQHLHQLQTSHNLDAGPSTDPRNRQGQIRSSHNGSRTCPLQASYQMLQGANTRHPQYPLPLPLSQPLLLLMACRSQAFSKQHNQLSLRPVQLVLIRLKQHHLASHTLSLYRLILWLKLS